MEKQKIVKAIETKNYTVTYEAECDCGWWEYDSRYLDVDTAMSFGGGNECWAGGVLYINGEPIAEAIDAHEFRHDVLVDSISEDDIPDEIWKKMVSWEANEKHEERKKETLAKWIEENGYSAYREDGRFANEYHLYLTKTPEAFEAESEDAYKMNSTEWVEDYYRYPTSTTMSAVTARFA